VGVATFCFSSLKFGSSEGRFCHGTAALDATKTANALNEPEEVEGVAAGVKAAGDDDEDDDVMPAVEEVAAEEVVVEEEAAEEVVAEEEAAEEVVAEEEAAEEVVAEEEAAEEVVAEEEEAEEVEKLSESELFSPEQRMRSLSRNPPNLSCTKGIP